MKRVALRLRSALASPGVLAALCVAALAVATVAAMVATQRLRQEGTVVSDIKMKAPEPGRYRICFQLPRDDTIEAEIVDAAERSVFVLARGFLEGDPPGDEGRPAKETAHCYDWDGRGEGGAPVAAGDYRLRVTLADADRVAVSGERITVEPPEPL
jgi:hypothetical protein